MINPPRKFIITCAARVGSTMLRHLLDSHPQIQCFGEVLSYPRAPGLITNKFQEEKSSEEFDKMLLDNPTKMLFGYIFKFPGFLAVGLKIKYSELDMGKRFRPLLEKLHQDKTVSIIRISRRNMLKRYVSHQLAIKTGIMKAGSNYQHRASPDQSMTTINIKKFIENVLYEKAVEYRYEIYFKQHRVFELFYEDILDSSNGKLAELQKFLDVDIHPLKSVTAKINSDSLEDIVENYAKLKHELRNTPYAVYFE